MPEMIGTQQIVVLLQERVQQLEQRLTAIEAKVNAIYDWYTAKPEGD